MADAHIDDCSICLSSPEDATRITPCQHSFCEKCILEWNRSSTTCPICRGQIGRLVNAAGNLVNATGDRVVPAPVRAVDYRSSSSRTNVRTALITTSNMDPTDSRRVRVDTIDSMPGGVVGPLRQLEHSRIIGSRSSEVNEFPEFLHDDFAGNNDDDDDDNHGHMSADGSRFIPTTRYDSDGDLLGHLSFGDDPFRMAVVYHMGRLYVNAPPPAAEVEHGLE